MRSCLVRWLGLSVLLAAVPLWAATTAPATRPADPDLVARWVAADARGQIAPDGAGRQHDLIPAKGAALRVEDVGGRKALRFKADGALVAEKSEDFAFSNDFSIAARIRVASDVPDQVVLSNRSDDGAQGYAIMHGVRGVGGLAFVAPGLIVPTPNKAQDDFRHLCVTYHDRELLLYVDGKAIGITEVEALPAPSKRALHIGGEPSGKRGFDGWVDDVRFYRRALSAAEVEQLASGREPTPPYRPLDKPTQERVRKLVRELSSDSYKAREKAAADLKEMGRNIFPMLKEYRDSEDPETAMRIRGLLGELPPADKEP